MTITLKALFNVALVDDLEAFADEFAREAQRVALDTINALEPLLLANLQQQPGSVKRPIDWTSEKQRRAFFATDGFGAGIPYRRTGRYAAGWYVNTTVTGGNIEMDIGNSAPYAQFVGGSLSQRSRNEALVYQQQFHANTGWGLALDSINPFLDQVREDTLTRFEKQYGEFVTTTVRIRSRIR